MSTNRSTDYLTGLIRELCKLPRETEWAEFKENDAEPETIGEYLSALANSAALAGKAFAYLVWGIRDSDHAIVGTQFSPLARKVGNEELENWLLRVLLPKIHFRFFSVEIDGLSLVILEVERAFRQPVQFKGREFVRVGSYKKPLKDFPEKERALWRLFDKTPFAKRLEDFSLLKRKAMRVIQYRGSTRAEGGKEQVGNKGYACGFEGLIGYVNGLLPSNEIMGQALRKDVRMYPELAVRELVANALIHQDFFISGAGPMVEIFADRIEISNPGSPLMATDRFVDTPPKSRNEALASLMRRIGICEERGSGWDKVVSQSEAYQLPAPLAEATDDHTRVILFAHRPLTRMDKEDRIRAVYLHACLRYVNRQDTNNTSIRERFGIEARNSATASRLIKEAVAVGAILPYDTEAAPKLMRYLPFWAAQARQGGAT